MEHTVIGVFRHSGDADLAAAHLQEEYALSAGELEVIGQAEFADLGRPAWGDEARVASAFTGGLMEFSDDQEQVGKRWGDKVGQGETLVVARANDPDIAVEIARGLREVGAERIDLLPG